ncbi:MAG TPA: signal peptidase I [Thermoanaerobaculia bacterium]|nr:signal peptidase I [Thermoanaerobaculia bacterium]
MARARRHPVWREYLEALLVAGLFLGFTNTFVLKTFYIPSGSMENTLLVGDHLIVNRYIYGPSAIPLRSLEPARAPRRGDIVVFRSPEDPQIDLVKRLVGLPGDTLQIVQKELYVNDRRVADDDYAVHRDPQTGSRRTAFNYQRYRRDNFGPYTVPEGHYFFLGDNRDFSYDSRYWGAVPEHFVKGRAFLIYWSYGGETPDGRWPGLGAKLGQLGRTALGFFTKSRWSRSFEIIH